MQQCRISPPPANDPRYGFSAAAVRDWEQKRRTPEKAARTLLMLIDKEPQAVERVLVGA
ncbi:XRE family transcriptional regulator [Acetobacter senegalensis DSM 18889]|nr:XRE family transcriptional regulator [Acetobacter senegalensis DSM 18889]